MEVNLRESGDNLIVIDTGKPVNTLACETTKYGTISFWLLLDIFINTTFHNPFYGPPAAKNLMLQSKHGSPNQMVSKKWKLEQSQFIRWRTLHAFCFQPVGKDVTFLTK